MLSLSSLIIIYLRYIPRSATIIATVEDMIAVIICPDLSLGRVIFNQLKSQLRYALTQISNSAVKISAISPNKITPLSKSTNKI